MAGDEFCRRKVLNMKRIYWVGVVALVLPLLAYPALAQAPASKANDEVKQFLENYNKAYEKKDVNALMGMIAPDAGVVFVDSSARGRREGPDQIKKALESEFAEVKSVATQIKWMSARVKGDVAWFVVEEESMVDTGDDKFPIPSRWSGVLEKRGGKWILVQSHFSFTDPEMEEEPKK
jgi:ketosteroid isomerase-like protein